MSVTDLPAVNASLNALSTVFLMLGFLFIQAKRPLAHRNCMMAALATSAIFLACYLYYHFTVRAMTKFAGEGWVRPVYFFILITHIILAVAIVPLILVTVVRALRERFDLHRKIARWTWPLWMYVSITGVVVYLMLYQFFPSK